MKPPLALVIDDNKHLRKAFSGLLKSLNFSVKTFEDPSEIDNLNYNPYEHASIVFLDINLRRGLNGVNVGGLIKQKHPYLPIVIITGRGTREEAKQAIENDLDGWMEKPFGKNNLIKTVERLQKDGRFRIPLEIKIAGLGEIGLELLKRSRKNLKRSRKDYWTKKIHVWSKFHSERKYEEIKHVLGYMSEEIKLHKSLESFVEPNAHMTFIASGARYTSGITREKEWDEASPRVSPILKGIAGSKSNELIITISNPIARFLELGRQYGIHESRQIGMGVTDSIRIRSSIAKKLGEDPEKISVLVGGSHGNPAYLLSTTEVNGKKIENYKAIREDILESLEEKGKRVQNSAVHVRTNPEEVVEGCERIIDDLSRRRSQSTFSWGVWTGKYFENRLVKIHKDLTISALSLPNLDSDEKEALESARNIYIPSQIIPERYLKNA
ncbi:response regulator [Candidatus Pacearchaeota archaeon]|nr:response regulator [Candidatus Pacearchaeota archaeon]